MTLTQLEYIIAVYKEKSFSKASRNCFVTQPTLSQQILKLEDLLQVKIFDRDCSPIRPTLIGQKIIHQAMRVIFESKKITEIINEEQNLIQGDLKLGVIPSIADSLIPLFLKKFSSDYPDVKLSIYEMQTSDLIEKLNSEVIDVGIAATPLRNSSIKEKVIYYEPFSVYLTHNNLLLKKSEVQISDLKKERLLMMSDGNCFRDQVSTFCRLKDEHLNDKNINFESSSFETLIKLVDGGIGSTILPYLTILNLKHTKRKLRVREFSKKKPIREISMIYKRSALKQQLLNALFESIIISIPEHLKEREKKSVLLDPIEKNDTHT